MLVNDYQRLASGTAVYPGRMQALGVVYCALKMNGEAGELAEHVYNRKYLSLTPDEQELVIKEIGDVMWYCAAMCDELEISLLEAIGTEPGSNLRSRKMDDEIEDLALRLNSRTGMIAELIGKAMRDEGFGMNATYTPGALRIGDAGNGSTPSDVLSDARRHRAMTLLREVVDTLRDISYKLNIELQWALALNIKKLASRRERGTLGGSGDNR